MRPGNEKDRDLLVEAWRGVCGGLGETIRRKNFLKFLFAVNNLCFTDALEENAEQPYHSSSSPDNSRREAHVSASFSAGTVSEQERAQSTAAEEKKHSADTS